MLRTFNKVSVLVPTRRRVERLRAMIASFDQTTGSGAEAELVFRVDDDDPVTQEFLATWGGHKVVIGPRYGGYRDICRFFNEAADAAAGDVLMLGNDDMIFRTPGWATLILAEANRYPDGLFDIGVSTHNEDHWPFATVSKVATEMLGFLCDPAIYWCDIYLRDVMSAFGRSVKLPSVTIDHEWIGYKPDDVFVEADQNSIYERDTEYWSKTHPTAVANAVVKLRSIEGATAT